MLANLDLVIRHVAAAAATPEAGVRTSSSGNSSSSSSIESGGNGCGSSSLEHVNRLPTNAGPIIVTLDADDCLARPDALSLVYDMHVRHGHDLVIGGQLRTDRTAAPAASGYGTAGVVFGGPARQRALRGGGEVWRHLRSFRRGAYCAVRQEDLVSPKIAAVQAAQQGQEVRALVGGC